MKKVLCVQKQYCYIKHDSAATSHLRSSLFSISFLANSPEASLKREMGERAIISSTATKSPRRAVKKVFRNNIERCIHPSVDLKCKKSF